MYVSSVSPTSPLKSKPLRAGTLSYHLMTPGIMPSIGKVLNKYLLYVYIYHFFTFFSSLSFSLLVCKLYHFFCNSYPRKYSIFCFLKFELVSYPARGRSSPGQVHRQIRERKAIDMLMLNIYKRYTNHKYTAQ